MLTGSTPAVSVAGTTAVSVNPSPSVLKGGDAISGLPGLPQQQKPHALPSTATLSTGVEFVAPGTRLLSIGDKVARHKVGGPTQFVSLFQFDEDTHTWRIDRITAEFLDGTPQVYMGSVSHWSNISLATRTVNDEPVTTVNYRTEAGTGSFEIGFQNLGGNAEPFYRSIKALPGSYTGPLSASLDDKVHMPAGTGLVWNVHNRFDQYAEAEALYYSTTPSVFVNERGMLSVLRSGIDQNGEPMALLVRDAGGLCVDKIGFESDGRGGTRPVFGGALFGAGHTLGGIGKC